MLDRDDNVSLYCIIQDQNIRGVGRKEILKAWTWDEYMAKTYLEFHNSPTMRLKELYDTYGTLLTKLSESVGNEILLTPIVIRDPEHKHHIKQLMAPMTENEANLIHSETSSMCSGLINYTRIWELFYYLKDEYQDALKTILFEECRKSSMGKQSKIINHIRYDELQILMRLNSNDFE